MLLWATLPPARPLGCWHGSQLRCLPSPPLFNVAVRCGGWTKGTREAWAWHRSYPRRRSAAVQLEVSLRVPGRLTWAGPGTDTPPAGGEHEARLDPAGLCLSHMDGRAGTVACCDHLKPGRRAVCPSHTQSGRGSQPCRTLAAVFLTGIQIPADSPHRCSCGGPGVRGALRAHRAHRPFCGGHETYTEACHGRRVGILTAARELAALCLQTC